MHDYHVHSNYSDGRFLHQMVRGAADAGLDGVGVADHCSVADDEELRRTKALLGFNLDRTYGRRREAIDTLREEHDVEIYDAVELDYDPADEGRIRDFLDGAGFDYAIGSVHFIDGGNVQLESTTADFSERERRDLVDEYYDRLVAMIEAECFDVAGHLDLVERNPALRGLSTPDHYAAVADALAGSRTVPEINAGRVTGEYGEFHPAPAFLDAILDRGVEVTVGTDSHFPGEFDERVAALESLVEERGVEPVAPVRRGG